MKQIIIISMFLLILCANISAQDYIVSEDTVYIDDSNVYLSATPHTIASSGWVYFNLSSKVYSGNIDCVWGFNTSITKPKKAELYSPHWVNTTTNHKTTFYNVSSFEVYTGSDLDYGNSYNTNYSYTVVHDMQTTEYGDMERITSNASFDSFTKEGTNYTVSWHTRRDKWTLWKDFTNTFNTITHNYQGFDKWYYIKNILITSDKNYMVRTWVEVPISLKSQTGKYYFAVKPSGETISQAITNGHFYNLDPWWNSSWTYYKTITINQTMVSDSIGNVDFPMLVSFTDTDLKDHAQADGDDIVFTDNANTTQLPHEIELWNSTTGELVAWVNVSDIANATSINMYYNNSAAGNTQDAEGVWDSNHVMVQHLNETPAGTTYDSTLNNNDGTTVNMVSTDQVTGYIDGGLIYNGADAYIGIPTSESFDSMVYMTSSMWAELDVVADNKGLLSFYYSQGDFVYMYFDDSTSGIHIWNSINGVDQLMATTNFIPSPNEWFYVTWVIDGTNWIIYIDGQEEGSTVSSTTLSSLDNGFITDIGIRRYAGVSRFWDGTIDEVRISNIARSAGWIETNYNNTAYPSLFISVGAEQEEGVPGEVTIFLHSTYPEKIYTNYTGEIFVKYIVSSELPLNMSSLAVLFGVNHTPTDDMHSYLKVPANSIASEGIYRAHNRNKTTLMAWELNNTITNSNVWQWSGGDINDFWIQNNTINATHSWINMSGVASNVFPSMHYISRKSMYAAPKTGVEINQHQSIIFKMFDLEGYRGRSNDHYVNMYFDTLLESTTPTDNIDIWYCNDSLDPLTDDPTTCPCCVKMDEWAPARWMDHEEWQPHNNVSYTKPLGVYAGQYPEIPPDKIVYIYLASDTQTSKSYVLNTTNYDPGICNISYAETETMWAYNELSDVSTPLAYTPSFFATFVRDYSQFEYQMYIANTDNAWGHSGINTTDIGQADLPPTHTFYNYFWWDNETDYNMTGLYTNSFWVNLTPGHDPDNCAPVEHTLSLYDTDYNYVKFINTSQTEDCEDIDIYVDTVGVTGGYYRLKMTSTDNEGSITVSWSNTFELPITDSLVINIGLFFDEIMSGLTEFINDAGKYIVWIVICMVTTIIFAMIGMLRRILSG